MTGLRDSIPAIISARNKAGAATPRGRRLSLLVEQIENGVPVTQTLAELNQLAADGGNFIYANHSRADSKGAL